MILMPVLVRDQCYIVDDNDLVRGSIEAMARSAGFDVQVFSSGVEFLEALPKLSPGIVLLDVRMPQIDGLEVLKLLRQSWTQTPTIMISGHADIPIAVKAIQAGAWDFIEKPIEPDDLSTVLKRVQDRSRVRIEHSSEQSESPNALSNLTKRELEVLKLLVQGDQNKAVAHKLGISARTVEVHRARMMQRLGVATFAELVRVAVISGISVD